MRRNFANIFADVRPSIFREKGRKTFHTSGPQIPHCLNQHSFTAIPPGTKPIRRGKNSWGINFRANTCGACIRTRANTGKYLRGAIVLIFPSLGWNSFRWEYMPHLYSHLREHRKIFLGGLFMYSIIGFVPGGIRTLEVGRAQKLRESAATLCVRDTVRLGGFSWCLSTDQGLRNARPATEIQNPETRNSSKKNSKITPRTPTPNSFKKNKKKY